VFVSALHSDIWILSRRRSLLFIYPCFDCSAVRNQTLVRVREYPAQPRAESGRGAAAAALAVSWGSLAMEDRIKALEARLSLIENRLPSWEARVKTLERNNPLEARLRALEVSHSSNHPPDNPTAVQLAGRSWMAGPFSWVSFAVDFASMAFLKMKPLFAQIAWRSRSPSGSSKHHELEIQAENWAEQHFLSPDGLLTAIRTVSFRLKDGLEGYSKSLELLPDDEVHQKPAVRSTKAKISLLHHEACERSLDTYIDPESGYEVFTAHHLKTRECCGSGCRHCPWGHRNVPGSRKKRDTEPAEGQAAPPSECDPLPHLPRPPKSRLYTRKGDAGFTNLYNEEWILKSEPVYEAIGDVDELNSAVGLAHAFLATGSKAFSELEAVQAWLLDIGSALCTPRPSTTNARKLQRTRGINQNDVATLETFIDEADARVAQLTNFILPGGSPAAAALHVARTVCRRAERHTWPLLLAGHGEELIGVFLNRLSDYLFVAARLEARVAGSPEKQYRIERKIDRWQRQVVMT